MDSGRSSGDGSNSLPESIFDSLIGRTQPCAGRSKRSRVAEVHNLTEKRRRSNINEKMRALQRLIPNCNKTDKASMLDEAIEYLKQLQLQVQMLCMKNGLLLPPTHFTGTIAPLSASGGTPMSSGVSIQPNEATVAGHLFDQRGAPTYFYHPLGFHNISNMTNSDLEHADLLTGSAAEMIFPDLTENLH